MIRLLMNREQDVPPSPPSAQLWRAAPMTALDLFREMMRERLKHPKGSLDWQWRTDAARKYLWIHWGVPTTEWRKS